VCSPLGGSTDRPYPAWKDVTLKQRPQQRDSAENADRGRFHWCRGSRPASVARIVSTFAISALLESPPGHGPRPALHSSYRYSSSRPLPRPPTLTFPRQEPVHGSLPLRLPDAPHLRIGVHLGYLFVADQIDAIYISKLVSGKLREEHPSEVWLRSQVSV